MNIGSVKWKTFLESSEDVELEYLVQGNGQA
jgi:hypothetical protein